MAIRLISLFTLCASIFLASAVSDIDPAAVDVLLREIRARLLEKDETNSRILPREASGEEDNVLNVVDVEGSGSGEGSGAEKDIEGSGSGFEPTGAPLINDEVLSKTTTISPKFDKKGNLKSKVEAEEIALKNLKKQAPKTIQEHYEANPKATVQMLQGLDVHGASGGYHRSLSGGYISPSSYDPYNVNWHSYGEKGVIQKDKAIQIFRKIFSTSS